MYVPIENSFSILLEVDVLLRLIIQLNFLSKLLLGTTQK